jgi:hypothetical protein
MTELERQRMLAAITRSNNAYTGAANPTLANVGQQAVNAGTTSGMVSGYVDAAKAQSERENAEAMARSFKGQESNIASQRARAASLRGKGTPQARMVGEGRWATLTQPNWGEQLEGVTNQLMGGYLEGQARKDAEQLDVDQTEQAGLVLAKEAAEEEAALALAASLAAQDQSNRDRTFDQTGKQYIATNALASERNRLTESGQQDDRDKGEGISVQDVNNKNNIMRAVVGPQGKLYSITDAGIRGDLLPSNWIQLETTTTGGTNLAIGEQQKQQGRMTLEQYRQEGRENLAELNARLREESDISEDERKFLIGQRVILRKLEREDREETGESALSAEKSITGASSLLRRDNLYDATGLGVVQMFTDITSYDPTKGGEIATTQRLIRRMSAEGVAQDLEDLGLNPISDYEGKYVINDLNPSPKDGPKTLLFHTMQANNLYEMALADGEKDGAIALGAAEQVMNQRYDDQVILGSLRNNGDMTMGITEMIENDLPVEEVYERLRKKLKDGTIDTREKQALRSLSQAYE